MSLYLASLERVSNSFVIDTLIAIFQSFAYKDFTLVGNVFAILTSMEMLGALMSLEMDLAIITTTIITIIV